MTPQTNYKLSMRSFADGPTTPGRSIRQKPSTSSTDTSGSGSRNGWRRSMAWGQRRSNDGTGSTNLGRKEAEMNLQPRKQMGHGSGAIGPPKPNSSITDRRAKDIGLIR